MDNSNESVPSAVDQNEDVDLDLDIASALLSSNFEDIGNLESLDDLVAFLEGTEGQEQNKQWNVNEVLDLDNLDSIPDRVVNNPSPQRTDAVNKENPFSVLGVELDLYIENPPTLNENTDFSISDCFDKPANNYPLSGDIEIPEDDSTGDLNRMQLLNTLPYTLEERNRHRRSLLYDSNRLQSDLSNNVDNSKLHRQRKPDALLNHDYTFKMSDEKCFTCPVDNCNKHYAKSSHLKSHLRRHSGEKPFACNWKDCSWKFSRSDELARHKRSHSGVKPYKCDMCEKAFARSDHLTKHRKIHCKHNSNSRPGF